LSAKSAEYSYLPEPEFIQVKFYQDFFDMFLHLQLHKQIEMKDNSINRTLFSYLFETWTST